MISALCAWQVCRHAVQDYACLGYALPELCRSGACDRGLKSARRHVVAHDTTQDAMAARRAGSQRHGRALSALMLAMVLAGPAALLIAKALTAARRGGVRWASRKPNQVEGHTNKPP